MHIKLPKIFKIKKYFSTVYSVLFSLKKGWVFFLFSKGFFVFCCQKRQKQNSSECDKGERVFVTGTGCWKEILQSDCLDGIKKTLHIKTIHTYA